MGARFLTYLDATFDFLRPRISRALKLLSLIAAAFIFVNASAFAAGQFRFSTVLNLFLGTLLGCVAVLEAPPLRRRLGEKLNAFADFMNRRGAFRSNAAVEMPKFVIIRLVFGGLMLQRSIWILSYLQPSDWNNSTIWLVALLNAVAALLVLAGFATQIALAYLVLFQWQVGDAVLGTSTLGNDIAAMLSLLLLFSNAGAHYSIDAWLRKSRGRAAHLASALYYESGLPPANSLQLAKFLTLFAYWCVCLYSLSMHLGEPAWMTGVAGPLLLTSKFTTNYATELAAFFTTGSWAVLIGRVSLWAMLPWYAFIIPFVLIGGLFRAYVIVWAVLFFGLSVLVLQLGWLGHFEFLMFAGLFWERRFIAPQGSLQVAYDDRCNLCDRTVQFVKAVDVFRRVELRPLSRNVEWLASIGIDPKDALVDLYGVEANASSPPRKGYEFYMLLARHVVLLLPFYPLLWIGRFVGGPAIYRFVATRRTQLFGVCEIASPKSDHRLFPAGQREPVATGDHDPIAFFFLHVMLLCCCYLLAMPAPSVGWLGLSRTSAPSAAVGAMAMSAHVYGVTPINVFNTADLRSAENWFTITAVGTDGSKTLLPILGEDGRRLTMHRSDRVYFGYTLRFRRMMIGHNGCSFDKYKTTFAYLTERSRLSDAVSYFQYAQFYQPLPEFADIVSGKFVAAKPQLVCEVRF